MAIDNPVLIISPLLTLPVPYIIENAGIAIGVNGATPVASAAVITNNLWFIPSKGDKSNKTGTRIIVADELLTKLANNIEIIRDLLEFQIIAWRVHKTEGAPCCCQRHKKPGSL